MMACPACLVDSAQLPNCHVTLDCPVAASVQASLARWFSWLTNTDSVVLFNLAWKWSLTPSERSPASVACFLLVVMAKRCLHNASVRAFVNETSVPSATVLMRMIKSLYVGRLLSARKSLQEFSVFSARSSLAQRFAGPRPLSTKHPPWFSCFVTARVARLSTNHWSNDVAALDPVQRAIDNMAASQHAIAF